MTQSALGSEPRPVEYQPAPASRMWIAACLGVGGAFFAIAAFFGLAEVLFAVKRLVLQVIFQAAS